VRNSETNESGSSSGKAALAGTAVDVARMMRDDNQALVSSAAAANEYSAYGVNIGNRY
jgi:hypothetical protein